jgi:hypothetical protein
MLLTIPRKELKIEIIVPNETKIKYFDLMYDKKPLYVCVLMDQNNVPRIYMEKSECNDIEGIVRVFLEKEDVNLYMNILVDEKKAIESSVKYWESNYEDLAKMLMRVDKSNKEKNKKGVRGVACAIVDSYIVDMDIFWTNEKNLMV